MTMTDPAVREKEHADENIPCLLAVAVSPEREEKQNADLDTASLTPVVLRTASANSSKRKRMRYVHTPIQQEESTILANLSVPLSAGSLRSFPSSPGMASSNRKQKRLRNHNNSNVMGALASLSASQPSPPCSPRTTHYSERFQNSTPPEAVQEEEKGERELNKKLVQMPENLKLRKLLDDGKLGCKDGSPHLMQLKGSRFTSQSVSSISPTTSMGCLSGHSQRVIGCSDSSQEVSQEDEFDSSNESEGPTQIEKVEHSDVESDCSNGKHVAFPDWVQDTDSEEEGEGATQKETVQDDSLEDDDYAAPLGCDSPSDEVAGETTDAPARYLSGEEEAKRNSEAEHENDGKSEDNRNANERDNRALQETTVEGAAENMKVVEHGCTQTREAIREIESVHGNTSDNMSSKSPNSVEKPTQLECAEENPDSNCNNKEKETAAQQEASQPINNTVTTFSSIEETKQSDHSTSSQTVRNATSPSKSLPKTSDIPVIEKDVVRWCILKAKQNLNIKYVPSELIGLDTERKELQHVVESAISNSENNSIILIGDHGSGKTVLLNSVLNAVDEKSKRTGKRVLKVQLNGLVQTDDALAIKEISRQLAIDDLWNEASGSQQNSMKGRGSFADHLNFILEILRELSQSEDGCPVVFVLDRFDSFAKRHKQTLLYNLFDLTQSRDSKMVVVGLTNRVDAVEQLEKRVKSRFSERQLLISVPPLNDMIKIILQRLLLVAPENWPRTSKEMLEQNWNVPVRKLITHAHDQIAYYHMMGYSVGWFLRLMLTAVSRLSMAGRRSSNIQLSDLTKAAERLTADLRVNLLAGLSTVEVVLVVAMVHLEHKEQTSYNFQMVFNYFERSMLRNDSLRIEGISKQVALKSFERLLDLRLIANSKDFSGQLTTSVQTPKEFINVRLMVDPDSVLDGITAGSIPCSTQLQMWAHKQL